MRVFGMPRAQMTACPVAECNQRMVVSDLVCRNHEMEIWDRVRRRRGDPVIEQLILESVAQQDQRRRDDELRQREVAKTQGWIYYLRLDEKIKIGWTSDLDQRMKAYPPHAIRLAVHRGSRADERDLHRTFTPFRVAGREWYSQGNELMSHIQKYVVVEDKDPLARIRAEVREDMEAMRSANPPTPRPPSEPRQLYGRALARAIINGEVDE